MTTTWPSGTLSYTYLDESTDNPANARTQLLDAIIKINSILSTVDAGATIHTSVNEGSGGAAAIDADKLDGQHGTYYTNMTNASSGTLSVGRGGTGVTGVAKGAVLCGGGGTNHFNAIAPGEGSYGDILTSQGPGENPIFMPVMHTTKLVISGNLSLSGAKSEYILLPIPYNGYVNKICINFFPAVTPSITVIVSHGAPTTVNTSGTTIWSSTYQDNNGGCSGTLSQTSATTVTSGNVFLVNIKNLSGGANYMGISIGIITT